MRKIKFCHILDNSNENRLLYNSIKYSDREKFEYTVITLEPEGKLQKQMEGLNVRSFSIDYKSRRQSISAFWKLFKFFHREQIQIVQTHLFNASLIGLAAARIARVPLTIFTGHHSHEVPLYKKKLLTIVDGISGRWFAKQTIAPSINMREIFIEHQKIPATKIEVVHHGFDLENWRRNAEAASDIRKEYRIEDKVVFGAVGRLFWVKDLRRLIESFSEATKDRNDVVLLIVGDGSDRLSLQNLIGSLQMERKVYLTGRRNDIAGVMKSFDVLIHSALAESFGMVFIEAFALGKPIISTRVGVTIDIINNGVNGFLVEPGNSEELVYAIRQMLERQPDWKAMGDLNIRIAEDFAIQKTQAFCDDLYLKWLGKVI